MSGRLLTELHRQLDRVGGEPEKPVVIVTGAGESFCTGADMKAADVDRPEPGVVPARDLVNEAGSLTGRTMASQELMA